MKRKRIDIPKKKKRSLTKGHAARIGFLTGQGLSAPHISELIDTEISSHTIRRMWRLWRIQPSVKRNVACFMVNMTVRDRAALKRIAEARGMTPEQWVERVLAFAIRDDMFDAIVDEG